MVGKIRRLKLNCMGNRVGDIGVCYEVYNIGTCSGESYIFRNGEYCGFGEDEMETFFTEENLGIEESISAYTFTNVMKLSTDFKNGFFSKAFERFFEYSI